MVFPRIIAVLGMLSFGLGAIVQAETLYVDPAGNDSSSGTAEQPLASMAGARDRIRILRAGTADKAFEVQVRKGEYFLSEPLVLTEADSGSESAPLIFRGEAGARPVFYGGVKLKGFRKVL